MNKKEKIRLLTIKANIKSELESTDKLINEIEKEANFWGVEATIEMQLNFASRIKNEIYYKRGIEYVLNQIGFLKNYLTKPKK